MGYYSKFELAVIPKDLTEDVRLRIEEISGYAALFDRESVKWYAHEKDLLQVSVEFPTAKIVVHRFTEDHKSTVFYALNGDMTIHPAVFPPPPPGFPSRDDS